MYPIVLAKSLNGQLPERYAATNGSTEGAASRPTENSTGCIAQSRSKATIGYSIENEQRNCTSDAPSDSPTDGSYQFLLEFCPIK